MTTPTSHITFGYSHFTLQKSSNKNIGIKLRNSACK